MAAGHGVACNLVAVGDIRPAVWGNCLSVGGMQLHTKVGVPVAVCSVGGMPPLPGELQR